MTEPAPTPTRLLGRFWGGYAGTSAFGACLRIVRLNALHAGTSRELGIVSFDFQRWLIDVELHRWTADLGGIPSSLLKDFSLERWWPFSGPLPWQAAEWRPRFCLACLATAYHSPIFQIPGLSHCPWHGERLVVNCPRCDRRWLPSRLPTGMRCLCSFDPVDGDRLPAGNVEGRDSREQAIDRIRAWAIHHRQHNWLQPPSSFDPHAWSAMQGLLDSPPQATPSPLPILREAVVVTPSDDEAPSAQDFRNANPGLARLPEKWLRDLGAVVDSALSWSGDWKSASVSLAHRIRALAWPVYRLPDHVAIDTSAFARIVRGDLIALAEAMDREHARGLEEWLGARWSSRALLAAAMRQILCRAYLEGLTIAARSALEIAANPGPVVLHRPWLGFRMGAEEPYGQLVWTALGSGSEAHPHRPVTRVSRLQDRLERQAQGLMGFEGLDGPNARSTVAAAYGFANWERLIESLGGDMPPEQLQLALLESGPALRRLPRRSQTVRSPRQLSLPLRLSLPKRRRTGRLTLAYLQSRDTNSDGPVVLVPEDRPSAAAAQHFPHR